MQANGNTILITGGGSGIGRGLAEAFHQAGNDVIIAGRRCEVLDAVTAVNHGMRSIVFDADDTDSVAALTDRVANEFPRLNVLINNAGIMRPENLLRQTTALETAAATVSTNLIGPMRLTAALLPLLQRQPSSVVMNVTSGLAFLPLAMAPTYCATKAALHSYTLSLRWQLRGTTTQVIELPPPYVQTHLGGPDQAADPRAMPLEDFIAEVMAILRKNPNVQEICVERVKPLRFAAESGTFDQTFQHLNESMPLPE